MSIPMGWNGPPNIPEFGTIQAEEGFENLCELDTTQHVRPTLISTGADEDGPERSARRATGTGEARRRIASIRDGAPDPTAHRRGSGGHGIGVTKSQDDALYADMWACVFCEPAFRLAATLFKKVGKH